MQNLTCLTRNVRPRMSAYWSTHSRAAGGRIGNSSFVGCHKGNREGHIGPGEPQAKIWKNLKSLKNCVFRLGLGANM